jgi:hypothetical protein
MNEHSVDLAVDLQVHLIRKSHLKWRPGVIGFNIGLV